MIITKLRLQENHPMTGVSDSWPLPIVNLNLDSSAGENGYILKEVQGLDPPNLVAVVIGFDSAGIPVREPVPEKREVVLRIGFNPGLGQSYGTLRDALYKMIDRTVFVNLMNDSLILAQTVGYIKQCDALYFSKQPDIQMTIECEDGEFSAPKLVNIPLTDLNTLHPILNYDEGTAPTGLDLKFSVGSSTAAFTISNHSRSWYSGVGNLSNVFTLTYPFISGDVVTISTQPTNKRITLLRAAVLYDLAGYINGGAVWPKLYPGVNAFDWTFAASWMTWVSASYIPKYWGV